MRTHAGQDGDVMSGRQRREGDKRGGRQEERGEGKEDEDAAKDGRRADGFGTSGKCA